MALDFYDYRPTNVASEKTAEKAIGTTKLRFPELVMQAQRGAVPSAILCVESVKTYEDGEQVATRLPNVNAQLSLEMMAEKFTMYHPMDGSKLGEMDYGTFIGLTYSFERGLFERAERLAQEAADAAALAGVAP